MMSNYTNQLRVVDDIVDKSLSLFLLLLFQFLFFLRNFFIISFLFLNFTHLWLFSSFIFHLLLSSSFISHSSSPFFHSFYPLHSCHSAINWTSCTALTWETCLTSLRHALLCKPRDRNSSQSVMLTPSYRDDLIRSTHRSEGVQGQPVRYALVVNCVLSCPVLYCTVLSCPVLLFDLSLHSLFSFPLFSSIFLRLCISITYS